jgi:hypothetical protein
MCRVSAPGHKVSACLLRQGRGLPGQAIANLKRLAAHQGFALVRVLSAGKLVCDRLEGLKGLTDFVQPALDGWLMMTTGTLAQRFSKSSAVVDAFCAVPWVSGEFREQVRINAKTRGG